MVAMMRPTLVLRERVIGDDGDLTEFTLWRVPRSSRFPEGVQYCLMLLVAGARRPVVLYANHYPTGHQRQFLQMEGPYQFSSVEQLLADFAADVARAKGRPKGA
jgi:hypothetical protein